MNQINENETKEMEYIRHVKEAEAEPKFVALRKQMDEQIAELKEKGINIRFQAALHHGTDGILERLYSLIKVGEDPYKLHEIHFRSIEDALYGLTIIGMYLTLEENDGYCVDHYVDHMVGAKRITTPTDGVKA